MYGYNSRENRAIKRTDGANKMADKTITNIHRHLNLIAYMTLRDRYDYGEKGLRKFWSKISSTFDAYANREVTSKELLTYCEVNKIDVYGHINRIPFSQKMYLADAKRGYVGMNKFIDASFIVFYGFVAVILKEEFCFDSEKVMEFFDHLDYYIDSYQRKYLDDNMIYEIISEECNIDLRNQN